VKCVGQGLSAVGHYKASSRALVGEEEVLEVKSKIRNKLFPYFFPYIFACCLIKKEYDLYIRSREHKMDVSFFS
jgi:hypothetical protein